MTKRDIAQQRLVSQGLEPAPFGQPAEAVAWLGAVQAQDYAGAKWSVAQRLEPPVTDVALDQAFAEGLILRTHVLRPTWHFVSPQDIRWLLALTAPRVHAVNAYMYRKLELDAAVFKRSIAALAKALKDGTCLTRKEMGSVLGRAGISATGQRLAYLMMYAELEGVVCSGPRRGRQFTYALLEARVPPAKHLTRDEALAELAQRYFTSRGPATVQDFVWWSGLLVADAEAGLEAVKDGFEQETLEGQTYWFSSASPSVTQSQPRVYLLPTFDEYLLSYKDRSASVSAEYAELWARGGVISAHILFGGRTVGCWRRDLIKDTVTLTTKPFHPLSSAAQHLLEEAAKRYGAFLGLRVDLLRQSSV